MVTKNYFLDDSGNVCMNFARMKSFQTAVCLFTLTTVTMGMQFHVIRWSVETKTSNDYDKWITL